MASPWWSEPPVATRSNRRARLPELLALAGRVPAVDGLDAGEAGRRPARAPPGPDRGRRAPGCRDGPARPHRRRQPPNRPPRRGTVGPWARTRGRGWSGTGRRRRRSIRAAPTATMAAAKWGRPTPASLPASATTMLVGDGNAEPLSRSASARLRRRRSSRSRTSSSPSGLPSSSTKYTSTCIPPGPADRHETSHPGTRVMPSSSARRRAGPMPASESWSVRATAPQPASTASSGIRSGGSLPSDTLEWVCRSIIPGEATGGATGSRARPIGAVLGHPH